MRFFKLIAVVTPFFLSPIFTSAVFAQKLLLPPSVVRIDPDELKTPDPVAPGFDSTQPIYACACGCGIFDVGTSSMLPVGAGGMAWIEYDYQNQVNNWNGHTSVPASYNPDKKLETSWYTPGFQYMFNRNWGIQAELPIADRFF